MPAPDHDDMPAPERELQAALGVYGDVSRIAEETRKWRAAVDVLLPTSPVLNFVFKFVPEGPCTLTVGQCFEQIFLMFRQNAALQVSSMDFVPGVLMRGRWLSLIKTRFPQFHLYVISPLHPARH